MPKGKNQIQKSFRVLGEIKTKKTKKYRTDQIFGRQEEYHLDMYVHNNSNHYHHHYQHHQ